MPARHLHVTVDDKFTFPPDVVTGTIVTYGNRGTGKTNFGSVLAEELYKSNLRFSVVDPVGVWWGLQHNAAGTGPGLDVLMLGGRRGDLPILPTAGAVVADMVVDEDISVVVDISAWPDGKRWSKRDKIRFVTDYAIRLYERQGEQKRPLMQIIDEAARFIPQVVPKGAEHVAECMGAIEDIVEEGRNVGLGICLITQRSARMNKSVSELCECMVAFRTIGPNSVAAIVDWFGAHIKKERWAELIEQLRELPRGQALVASPGWLKYEGVATIRMRETFDSSATPTLGTRSGPKKLTRKDLERYQERMQETVQEAEARDPKKMQAIVAAKDREIARLKAEVVAGERRGKPEIKMLRARPVVTDAQIARLEKAGERVRASEERIVAGIRDAVDRATKVYQKAAREYRADLTELLGRLREMRVPKETVQVVPVLSPVRVTPTSGRTRATQPTVTRVFAGDRGLRVDEMYTASNGQIEPLSLGERKTLAVLAQHGAVDKKRLTVLTGYKRSSRDAYLQRLKAKGLVETDGGRVTPTLAGEAMARSIGHEPLPTGDALLQYWLARLPEGERRVLDVLAKAYPESVSRDEISEVTGYKRSSRDAYLQRLKARGVVVLAGKNVQAHEALFDYIPR